MPVLRFGMKQYMQKVHTTKIIVVIVFLKSTHLSLHFLVIRFTTPKFANNHLALWF